MFKVCINITLKRINCFANFFITAYSLIKNTQMNELITPLPIDKATNKCDYRIFFKGIWTGVLISLIVHYLANHNKVFINPI